MQGRQEPNHSTPAAAEDPFRLTAPQISLPKGGGAIRGIGEKFAASPVTGTGSLSVPLAISPGRGGFGPQLALAYDSGAGNGCFGLGWNLSLPSIARRTDKGLPQYLDREQSDVFMLSGAEDLVPVFKKNAAGQWLFDAQGNPVIREDPRTIGAQTYQVRRYQPRIEGLFSRIERWSNDRQPGDVFWRTISRDNITTWYGRTAQSRIADPSDSSRVFCWLICESYDDKGNAIAYEYAAENAVNVDRSQASERNRIRTANRYLSRIKYGNTPSRLSPDFDAQLAWHFEVQFDYGEPGYREDAPDADANIHAYVPMQPADPVEWPVRADPQSSYRSGFEVRSYRLCRRVLMFHRFAELLGDAAQLVRSTEIDYAENPIATHVRSITHCSYVPAPGGTTLTGERRYLKRTLPPLEFDYSEAAIDGTLRDVAADSLENLPCGLDGMSYRWIDLEGEGLPGILSEQGSGWFYKRNLAPINLEQDPQGYARARAKFAPLELVAARPNATLAAAAAQFMDLAGDGQPDLVMLDGPTPGFYEHDGDSSWEPFRAFIARLNRNSRDPNLRLVDLDGDGRVDVLITEDDALTWHPSLGEDGFGAARRVSKTQDEETGPQLVFADGTESVYLADMSGDGLVDLVRIRNGEVCYWPNLGYGAFGAKVTMDDAPWFDAPDVFDQRRIRLADLDGSGVIDIVYLHGEGVRLYFNQSGNRWSPAREIPGFPRVDDLSSVIVADLLGNGTACLVWSSPLAGDARRPMKYIDLLSGRKPHLLIGVRNNLGATTTIEYAPSTRFYLQDKLAGKPWIARLPFPVQCVAKVSVFDRWRNSTFSSTYSYHHGYFDGVEREFRGFGRVEQIDAEDYGEFSAGNAASPYITDDLTLYQPPIKTIAWFHTGVFVDERRILSQYADEYFPAAFIALHPDKAAVLGAFRENPLPEPDFADLDLTAEEWREALRACKGMPLRQEIYELDVDSLRRGEHNAVRIFSSAHHNCRLHRLQPRFTNRNAVFLATQSESITYNYELDLAQPTSPDPRINHALNLQVDDFGRALQSIVVAYPRLLQFTDATLNPDDESRIRAAQRELHLGYVETRYTDDDIDDQDNYRLRMLCEARTYELTGIDPQDAGDALTADPRDDRYFSIDELRRYRLSERYQTAGTAVAPLEYHQSADGTPQKRLIAHVRSLYFDDADDSAAPTAPLAFGQHGPRGLKYEDYRLASTDDLLNAVFQVRDTAGSLLEDKLDLEVESGLTARDLLADPQRSGYVPGTQIEPSLSHQYWMRSGIAAFSNDAATHFFMPQRYTDPFGNVTTLAYDAAYLFVASSADALGNVTTIEKFDFRVLAPTRIKDLNANVSAVAFDVRGFPTSMASMGKVSAGAVAGESGDTLSGATLEQLNPRLSDITSFFAATTFDGRAARRWLDKATTRFLYHFGESLDAQGDIVWETTVAGACSIQREKHEIDAANVDTPDTTRWIAIQAAFEYSDGGGNVLVKKVQAEPDPLDTSAAPPLRWIANGKAVFNNKGKAVKQYEPYFSDTGHRFDAMEAQREVGVTPVMYYDAASRLVRIEMPDGTLSRIEFSAWQTTTHDTNDTVLESQWYVDRGSPAMTAQEPTDPEERAAWLATLHSKTPTQTHADSLGRQVLSIVHNRVENAAGSFSHGTQQYADEKYSTFSRLDAEGKPLWMRDARGNLVMQYIRVVKATRWVDEANEDLPANSVPCYDIAGNLLFQHSMDAGDRWMLTDAAGKTMATWDRNQRQSGTALTPEDRLYFTKYDALHRAVEQWLRIDGGAPVMIERFEYRDARNANGSANAQLAADQAANLIGQLIRHYDSSGRVERVAHDFKGNLLETRRRLNNLPTQSLLDWQSAPENLLEAETFTQICEFDALDRETRRYHWHLGVGTRVAVYEPVYNQRGLLESETLRVRATKTAAGADETGSQLADAIAQIRYNAKGQKEYLALGNGTLTQYDYDPQTFRLKQLRTTRPADRSDFPARRSNRADSRIVQQLLYTYDAVGNITELTDEAYQPVFFQNQQVDARSKYEYDALYRLTSAQGRENGSFTNAPTHIEGSPVAAQFPIDRVDPNALRNYAQTYRYDAVGNVQRMHHEAGAGTWTRRFHCADDSNRLTATWDTDEEWTAVASNRVTQYDYDTHGNMLNLARTSPRFNMRWDRRDMIESIDLGGGGTAYYQYEAGKQRTRKRIERTGMVEERIYLGAYELYRRYKTTDPTLAVEEIESLHLFAGQQRCLLVDDVIATDRKHANGIPFATDPIFRYQYGNQLGSACLELDERAAIISYEEYHPYGTSAYRAVAQGIEAPIKRYRYTGMEMDQESGLSYHSARYLATWLARWLSSDPMGPGAGLNTYEYVGGSPTRLADISGYGPLEDGLEWEKTFMQLAKQNVPVVRNVTVKATIDGKTVESVLDGLALTSDGFVVLETKLSIDTKLRDAQIKIRDLVKKSGSFRVVATDAKKLKELSDVLHLSPGPKGLSIKAVRYEVANSKNAPMVLSKLIDIAKTQRRLFASDKVMVVGAEEIEAAYKLAAETQGMKLEQALEVVRAKKLEQATAAAGTKLLADEGKAIAGAASKDVKVLSGAASHLIIADSPGDLGLGGMQESPQLIDAAATGGVENVSFLEHPVDWISQRLNAGVTGDDSKLKGPAPKTPAGTTTTTTPTGTPTKPADVKPSDIVKKFGPQNKGLVDSRGVSVY